MSQAGKPIRSRWILPLCLVMCGIAAGVLIQKSHLPYHGARMARSISRLFVAPSPVLSPGECISIRTRTLVFPSDSDGKEMSENDSWYVFGATRIDPRALAIILVDVWDEHPNTGWQKREIKNVREKVAPLLGMARAHGLTVIHAPTREAIAREATPIPGEYVVDPDDLFDDTPEVEGYLKSRGVTTLLYAGYASNGCLIMKPCGMLPMKLKGFDVIIVRDCTIAIETPESLAGEWNNKAVLSMIEMGFGSSTTVADIAEAFASAGRNSPGDAAEAGSAAPTR